jgi:hypothetical protein
MGRTLSGATATALAQQFTQPGFLLQFGFSSVVRYSSRADVVWGGWTWQANNFTVSQVQELPNGSATMQVNVGNTDRAFGALVLSQAPQEVPVSVWAVYSATPAAGDPVPFFSGVIDSVGEINESSVTLSLSDLNASTLVIPRLRIARATGFTRLSANGRLIDFNGQRYILTRAAN